MKLTVSLIEAEEAVRKMLGLESTVEIVISRNLENEFARVPSDLANLIRKVDNFMRDNQLIAAIKEVRSFKGFGLKEAKDIVEGWSKTRPLILKLKRLPNPVYVAGDYIPQRWE